MLIVAAATCVAMATPSAPPPPEERPFSLGKGWRWVVDPIEVDEVWANDGFSWIRNGAQETYADGALLLGGGPEGSSYAHNVYHWPEGAIGTEMPSYEVVVLDALGRRLKPTAWGGTATRQPYVVQRFSFSAEQTERIARVGLARLDLDGRRERARAAAAEAAASGAEAMPLPVPGEPFEFDLPTMDGGRIRSADLRGKVVLVDFWATWCTPCMEAVPELKRLARDHAEDGLVIVGVDFDEQAEPAIDVARRREMAWPQVHAASTAAGYDGDLWADLTDITTIPRILLIDRGGVLRDDFYPHDIEARVAPLLEGEGR